MNRWRDKRIGIDLDKCSEFTLLKTYFNATAMNCPVTVKRTRHGYHIRIFKKNSLKENFAVRRHLGDDANRIAWDEMKQRIGIVNLIDTLFESKMESDGSITVEQDHNLLALPFLSRIPALKKRNKQNRHNR